MFRGDAPATQTAQHGRLRQRAIAAVEDLAGLKQPRPRLLPVEVAAQGRQEPGPQADAHPRQIGGNGVKQGQTLRFGKQQGLQGRVDEAVGDGLLVAPLRQGPSQGGDAGLLARRAHGQADRRQGAGDVLVAVDAGNFLDQIRLYGKVKAVGWRLETPFALPARDLF